MTTRITCALALALLAFPARAADNPAAAPKPPPPAPVDATAADNPDFVPPGYKLAWSDEFDGDAVDTAKWHFRTGVRYWSVQKPENVSVANGVMRLHLRKETVGQSRYTAGGLISKPTFKYGYYQARFKIPAGKGWHTSFWMMPYTGRGGGTAAEIAAGDGTAPATDSRQEIDVCENDSINPRFYALNLHQWLPTHRGFGSRKVLTPDLSANFHTWACEFTEKEMKFYFNGQHVHTYDATQIPHHAPQSIWLTSIAGPLGNTDRVDDSKLPATAEFDWVRFYEKR